MVIAHKTIGFEHGPLVSPDRLDSMLRRPMMRTFTVANPEPIVPASNGDNDQYRRGSGNWAAAQVPVDQLLRAADEWREALKGVRRPWLCWNVDGEWCLVQQRLVAAVGWTPVVGGDPRCERPPMLENSVYVDFNKSFGFPTMWMHFPLEFAFAFAERIAFWHSDLLIRREKMEELARTFDTLEDGTIAAVKPKLGLSGIINRKTHRYWELVGCTTYGASKSQFDRGCGWWMNFAFHPNCTDDAERERRREYFWDHGAGILYWEQFYGGRVIAIKEATVSEGHCSQIGSKNYERVSPNNAQRFLAQDLRHNFVLNNVCQHLGLESLLEP